MRKTQKGFTVIEGLLMVVILAIIGGTSYYVYHSKQQTDKILNSAQDETSAVKATKKVATSNNNPPSAPSTKTPPSSSVFKIPELGIEFTIPSSISDLTYAAADSSGVDVSTKALSSLDPNCAATSEQAGLGGIGKRNGTYTTASAPDIFVIQLSGYFIVYDPPQMGCSSNQAATDQVTSDTNALEGALKSTEAISN